MSLRRTGIARKSELRRRTPMPRGKREFKARAARTIARQRDTGPSQRVRWLVLDRADGCCELCGTRLHDGTSWLAEHSIHHRRPRGQGGSTWPGINLPSNLLLLCGSATSSAGCHMFVEKYRTAAKEEGWLVPYSTDSAVVPVTVYAGERRRWLGEVEIQPMVATRRVLLTVDGGYQDDPPSVAADERNE